MRMEQIQNATEDSLKKSVIQYSSLRSKYNILCEETQRIIKTSFKQYDIPCHIIEGRAKTVESFERKAFRKKSPSEYRYKDPVSEITDLAGVRIITYTLKDVERVCDFISKYFDVVERRDVGDERFKDGKFGYQSIHFLVKYNSERTKLPEFSTFAEFICEIQVRTVLQHAWAEIEHDIQYKNQSGLPSALQRKFIALAGLLEIADREFQAIQDEDRKLKGAIIESLQEELTKDAIAESSRENDTSISNTDSNSDKEADRDLSIRQLIRAGEYDEAISFYDRKIADSPSMYTLYLGRSKAKFLSGDRAGALADVDEALALQPGDLSAIKLREQLELGTSDNQRIGKATSESNELTKQANEFLERGDGISAFEYYSLAQEAGASRPFSIINKAMACFLASDFEGSKYLLGVLDIRHGTPMSVSIVAMYCLIYACVSEEKFSSEMSRLSETIIECDNFNFKLSPLAKLRRGMSNWKGYMSDDANKLVNDVFNYLENLPSSSD